MACPILEMQQGGSEDGWLGAAVATAICERAAWILGGERTHTRIPAELLGIAPVPHEAEATPDPFSAPDARQRSLAEALRVGTAAVEGTVERHGAALHVRAHLRGGRAPAFAEVEGTGTVREVAVQITDAWARAGVLPHVQNVDEDVARWTLVSDGSLALARFDADQAWWSMERAPEACAILHRRAAELEPLVLATVHGCDEIASAPVDDPSTPPRLALTAAGAPSPRADLIEPLERARREEPSPLGLATLAAAEARALNLTDRDRGIETMLVAATAFPRGGRDVWTRLAYLTMDSPVGPAVNQSYWSWAPCDPDAWATGALPLDANDPRRLELLRRAHAVGPHNTSVAADLAFAQLDAGSVAGARAIAAEIADAGPDHRFVSELISVVATSAEGRIGAAMERAAALIASLDGVFTYRRQDYYLASWVAELTVLTGDRSLANAYLERVVAETSRSSTDDTTGHDDYVAILAMVGEPRLARAALARLASADTFVDGVRAHLAGDERTAARLLRQQLASLEVLGAAVTLAVLADLLESHGGADLVERADVELGTAHGYFGGIGMREVRVARRHAARGEHELARTAARRVIDALTGADIDLDVLDEMRRLAAEPRH